MLTRPITVGTFSKYGKVNTPISVISLLLHVTILYQWRSQWAFVTCDSTVVIIITITTIVIIDTALSSGGTVTHFKGVITPE